MKNKGFFYGNGFSYFRSADTNDCWVPFQESKGKRYNLNKAKNQYLELGVCWDCPCRKETLDMFHLAMCPNFTTCYYLTHVEQSAHIQDFTAIKQIADIKGE